MKRRFNKIQDRFTNMKKADGTPMSRQQIHMLRKRARGLCWICSKPALEGGYFCLEHQVQARERMRKKLGCRRRNLGAASYKLEKEPPRGRRSAAGRPGKRIQARGTKPARTRGPVRATGRTGRSRVRQGARR